MPNFVLEACIDSPESALEAAAGGATRFELCANLIIGGTTPDPTLFRWVRAHTVLPIHVLLRPRFGDFLYTPAEHELLCAQAEQFAALGADAVVIGELTADGALDEGRMRELIAAAHGCRVTLHRAFDVCADPFASLETAKRLGVHTILTSGQRADCLTGADLLRELVARAEGVEILIGAGVNAAAIEQLVPRTGARAFHLSGKTTLDSGMTFRRSDVPMGLPGLSEYTVWRTDRAAIAAARAVLERFYPA